MELKKNQEIRNGILYDKITNVKFGQVEFEKVQVDTLGYMPLTDKVLKMLNGVMEFKADDSIETDYDEPEAENWDNLDEDNLDVQPFDEYSDRIDIIDTQKELIQKVEATTIVEAANNQKESNIVQSEKKSDISDKEANIVQSEKKSETYKKVSD